MTRTLVGISLSAAGRVLVQGQVETRKTVLELDQVMYTLARVQCNVLLSAVTARIGIENADYCLCKLGKPTAS